MQMRGHWCSTTNLPIKKEKAAQLDIIGSRSNRIFMTAIPPNLFGDAYDVADLQALPADVF